MSYNFTDIQCLKDKFFDYMVRIETFKEIHLEGEARNQVFVGVAKHLDAYACDGLKLFVEIGKKLSLPCC